MHSLEADPAAALASFSQLCTEQGLLKRPSKLGESDVVDGINDDTALLSLPVTKTTCLVDASALSLKQAWDMRDYAQEISWILATCYPETISRIIVCNAPPSFAMIWNVVKGFVDPRTAEKLVILKSDQVYSTLEKCMDHINIPKQFGGEFVFQNGMLPDLDEGIRQTLFWVDSKSCLPPGPLKWVQDGENRKAIATGAVGGIERAEEIAVLKKTG
ncbi:hypothetical protein APSETT444_008036 [Aspergillus pseudonomiae]